MAKNIKRVVAAALEEVKKPKIFFGMDGVLADFQSGISALEWEAQRKRERRYCDWRYYNSGSVFSMMKTTKGAKRAVSELAKYYDLYVLSTAQWNNSNSWGERLEWVQNNFGGKSPDNPFFKKVILTGRKDMVFSPCSYLIDDRYVPENGAGDFIGRKIWLRLPGNKRAKCAEKYENNVEECRSWYDVLHRLITLQQGDDSWTQFEEEVSDSSN